MEHKQYPSDLTDAQWGILQPLIPPPTRRTAPKNRYVRGPRDSFYVARQGCTWRWLPHDFPPWKTVYNYFQWFQWDGTLQRLLDTLRPQVREKARRPPTPTPLPSTVSESKRPRAVPRSDRRGKKDHAVSVIPVDSMGSLIAVVVTAANVDDAQAAQEVLAQCRAVNSRDWSSCSRITNTITTLCTSGCGSTTTVPAGYFQPTGRSEAFPTAAGASESRTDVGLAGLLPAAEQGL